MANSDWHRPIEEREYRRTMTREEFQAALDRASANVRSWPSVMAPSAREKYKKWLMPQHAPVHEITTTPEQMQEVIKHAREVVAKSTPWRDVGPRKREDTE